MNIDVAIVKDFFLFSNTIEILHQYPHFHIHPFSSTCVLELYRAHLFFSSSLFWASNCRFQAGTADSFLSFVNPVKTTIFKTLAVNTKVI